MKFLTATFFTLVTLSTSFAQTGAAQTAINEQVWRPFIQAYNNLDADGFLAVHADDAIRILRDNDDILPVGAYAENIRQNMAAARERGMQRQIELRFTERFADGDLAFEAGYYQVVTTYDQDEKYTFYGRFNVVLRRDNGRWKILLDSDTNDGGAVGATHFQQARPME